MQKITNNSKIPKSKQNSSLESNPKIKIQNNYVSLDRKVHLFDSTSKWDKFLSFFNTDNLAINIFLKISKILIEFFFVAWIVVTITFFLINSVPGDPSFVSGLSAEQKAAELAKYGLNLPIVQRYFNYLYGILTFDFGISTALRPRVEINDFIWSRFLVSFSVGIFSVFLTIATGVPLGIWVGKNPGKFLDNASTVVVSIFSSIPSLVFSLLLLLIGRAFGIPFIYDIKDFTTYILPAIALAMPSVTAYIKYIRYELNNELNSMHAKFAYVKGVSRNGFVWKHALKASLFPIATFFPAVVLGSFIGSLFVEKIFLITGSGGILINAIESKDFNIILFLVILYSLLTIISFTLRDISYELLDPRVRRKGK
ncbi:OLIGOPEPTIDE ABC TRANSPORTER SYSTEM PERMEASE PROTEIN OPPB [Mycoplasmopsis pulmonis]|uniref:OLIGOPEPTIDE ABC TRANSPORTER SYSTEM PERMEASE PROTEIN OPPB n=1 Tax=Mycoplasmopsis pulmonis (strain UAB CTIP) TaxID=272635 RepID=Q98QF6_MYCPU|nr:ABC transporter permease [Mycoplasmopsis pulmonis]MDZ7293351.1 ABC transporter permease [Mycoplasmopsis pulmonis]CAC13583.1 OLIGOPEPTIDE ABC TRANSPORTER SYSTEM PERMEASE PROTEIN OPPB [Mycoplasmopsis pulmonis]VEU68165.1 Dipeptide transport system permease protein dppB [Mycoplasmopsis pulmonis]